MQNTGLYTMENTSQSGKNKAKDVDKDTSWNFRFGAWLPWLPLLWLGVNAVGLMQGFLDELLPLAIYVLISFPIGIAVCGYYRKDLLGFVLAASILFGGPALGLAYRNYESNRWADKQQISREHLAHYCKEYAGEKIYRKIADVEGVFHINPHIPYSIATGDQYDTPSPWIQTQQSRSEYKIFEGGGKTGYLFVEYHAQPGSTGPPYLRSLISYKNDLEDLSGQPADRSKESLFYFSKQSVGSLESEYGWRVEDLTTTAMRDQWISGGTVQIVELASNELLAEHTGFYIGKGAFERGKSWAIAKYPMTDMCMGSYQLESFIRKVLVPPKTLPSNERLDSLKTLTVR